MRALLVTSRMTFVPRNYDDLVIGMASCPQIAGLLVLDNASVALALRATALLFTGAPRIGGTLLAGHFGPSRRRRVRAYAQAGKPVFSAHSINTPEVAELVRREQIDVLVNARTREIYRKRILQAPRLGCINVHHGLLPEQRGVMCDLWALLERRPAGFSIHVMERAIDAGRILRRVRVSDGRDRDYLDYLARSARREAEVLAELLARIDSDHVVAGRPNAARKGVTVRREPSVRQLRAARKAGVRA
jgi:methionyl-tRNA formyltransferase